jgi:hypothetical protein
MKEFNQMVHTAQQPTETNHHNTIEIQELPIPAWSKIVAPIVALAILVFLYCQYSNLIH